MNFKMFDDQDELLVHINYHLGVAKIVYSEPSLRPAAERWIEHGVRGWREVQGISVSYTKSVTTPSSYPDFLFKLKDNLEKQFTMFRYEIDVEVFR